MSKPVPNFDNPNARKSQDRQKLQLDVLANLADPKLGNQSQKALSKHDKIKKGNWIGWWNLIRITLAPLYIFFSQLFIYFSLEEAQLKPQKTLFLVFPTMIETICETQNGPPLFI